VIMNHSKNAQATTAVVPTGIWQLCVNSAPESEIVGPPPSSNLRLDAATCQLCPPGTVSHSSGQCLPCASNEIVEGNSCVVCPPGSIVDAELKCVPCGPREISSANQCVRCDFFQIAARSSNTCTDCSADATVDWRSLADSCPSEGLAVPIASSAVDTCPDQFWLEVTNIDDAMLRAELDDVTFDGLTVTVGVPSARSKSRCESTQTLVTGLLGSAGSWTPIGGAQGSGVWQGPEFCNDDFCESGTCLLPTTLVAAAEIASGQRNLRVLGSAQRSIFGLPLAAPGEITVTAAITGEYFVCRPR